MARGTGTSEPIEDAEVVEAESALSDAGLLPAVKGSDGQYQLGGIDVRDIEDGHVDFDTLYEAATDGTTFRTVYSTADPQHPERHDKSELIGIPLVITRCTFRSGAAAEYVSAEGQTAAGHIVINDGSTGIRRQLVEYLAYRGYIAIPDPDWSDPAYAEFLLNRKATPDTKGLSKYDLPFSVEWVTDLSHETGLGTIHFDQTTAAVYTFSVLFRVPGGLRASKYEANGREAVTYYLA